MATYPASQRPKTAELTLADVLVAVQGADLSNRTRQELASAVRTIGRALDRPLERIPGRSTSSFAQRLKAVAPRTIGLAARSWSNVRSRLRTALGLVQPDPQAAARTP